MGRGNPNDFGTSIIRCKIHSLVAPSTLALLLSGRTSTSLSLGGVPAADVRNFGVKGIRMRLKVQMRTMIVKLVLE